MNASLKRILARSATALVIGGAGEAAFIKGADLVVNGSGQAITHYRDNSPPVENRIRGFGLAATGVGLAAVMVLNDKRLRRNTALKEGAPALSHLAA